MIKVQNIYYMLAYAFQNLSMSDVEKNSYEEFEYADNLFAVILANGIARQIKSGLGKAYMVKREERLSPKGKINLSATMRRQSNHDGRIVCSVDEYLENTYMNQILKSVSYYLLHSKDVDAENKRKLKRVLLYFGSVDLIDVSSIDWGKLQYNRNNSSYKMLMNICYLIVKGMLMTTEEGNVKLNRFIDDQRMAALYERFIYEYYRKTYPEFSVTRSQIDWNSDDGIIELLPRMKSDVMIEMSGKTLIIDAKYYDSSLQTNTRFGNQTIHSGNLYQIYSYVKNKDTAHTGDVSGMLLYANTEGNNPDNEYRLDGNKISVKTLDLNCDFSSVKMQLDSIAETWKNENHIN